MLLISGFVTFRNNFRGSAKRCRKTHRVSVSWSPLTCPDKKKGYWEICVRILWRKIWNWPFHNHSWDRCSSILLIWVLFYCFSWAGRWYLRALLHWVRSLPFSVIFLWWSGPWLPLAGVYPSCSVAMPPWSVSTRWWMKGLRSFQKLMLHGNLYLRARSNSET